MDAVSIGLLSGAVGGLAGKVAEGFWSLAGRAWFRDYYERHGKEAREQAENNVLEL